MRTLLVNAKMSPQLAARVEASVRGKRVAAKAANRRRYVSVARLSVLLAIVGVSALVLTVRHRQRIRFAQERAELLTQLQQAFAGLSAEQRGLSQRIPAALAAHARVEYDGDLIADDLRSEAGLDAALAVSSIYLRAPLVELSKAANLMALAGESSKDALLHCLQSPPAARSEKTLRASVRQSYLGEVPSHSERLFPLLLVAPLWSPEWERSVRAASSELELDVLAKRFRRAPVKAAVRAAQAEHLLLVLDEAGDRSAPAELDGERPHAVRLILSRLNDNSVRLRLRRNVDPTWLSAPARAEYARALDSCALALDVRKAVLDEQASQRPGRAATSTRGG